MNLINNPLVTIYITNYNYCQYLHQSIKSVLNQTFKDFELLIIDDGSNDGSKSIIEEYSQIDNIFSVYQLNKGLNASNNVALKMARGKYIMRLDADDFLAPQAIEIMTSEMERNPDCALVFPDYYFVDDRGEIIQLVKRHDFENDVTLFDQPAHGACTMIRTEVLKAIGGYDPEFFCQDGYDLWLNITEKFAVNNISLPLFYYRQHQKNLSKNENILLKARSKIKAKQVKKRKLEPLSVLAIIPTRGEKIDPKSSPLRKLGEKNLIDWTIDAVLGSELVKNVIVTTPDQLVVEYVSNKYDERIFCHKRDSKLAKLNTSIQATTHEVVEIYNENHTKPDAILLLYIEYPFRSTMYIDKAINTMQLYDVDIVDAVRTDDEMFYVHTGGGLEPWYKNKTLRLEREELYRRVGGIQLINREFLMTEKEMFSGKIGHISMDEKSSFFIRSELHWDFARVLTTKEG